MNNVCFIIPKKRQDKSDKTLVKLDKVFKKAYDASVLSKRLTPFESCDAKRKYKGKTRRFPQTVTFADVRSVAFVVFPLEQIGERVEAVARRFLIRPANSSRKVPQKRSSSFERRKKRPKRKRSWARRTSLGKEPVRKRRTSRESTRRRRIRKRPERKKNRSNTRFLPPFRRRKVLKLRGVVE